MKARWKCLGAGQEIWQALNPPPKATHASQRPPLFLFHNDKHFTVNDFFAPLDPGNEAALVKVRIHKRHIRHAQEQGKGMRPQSPSDHDEKNTI